jgi:hypothetical protein
MARKILPALLVLIGLSLVGCGEYGQVEQGRVVKYDTSTTPTATAWIIKDNGIVDRKPDYTVVPAHAFTIPADPAEMGQAPHAALRVNLDVDKKIITMYNFEKGDFDKLPFELIERHDGVNVRRRHPLVWDAEARKERKFPVIKAEERSMTIYSRRQEMLVTIKLSEEDFGKYKAEDWDAGDEVRIYYKEPGKSLRFMNVTRTDITRR